jgi:hypothetical protein
MLSDKLKRWLIANRAWEIYVLLQKLPEQENDLLSNLDDRIEDAAFTGNLRLYALWPLLNKKLSVQERYAFPKEQLHIDYYSYVLSEIGDRVIIRADSAPHHERDYHRKLLTNFPHHLHDESGRSVHSAANLKISLSWSHHFCATNEFSYLLF